MNPFTLNDKQKLVLKDFLSLVRKHKITWSELSYIMRMAKNDEDVFDLFNNILPKWKIKDEEKLRLVK